jgi:LCP family protein required for cell wall assembly
MGTYHAFGARHRKRRMVLVLTIGVALLAVSGVGAAWAYERSVNNRVARTDAFAGLPSDRPSPAVSGAENILLLGSDSRDPSTTVASRTDTIILFHLDADHRHAYGISIPRDTWVHVPASANGEGGGMAKINAAYGRGGTPLVVTTIEQFTGVRIDHVALVDFAGFRQVVDALGGVDMNIDKTITSIFKPHRIFRKGMRHLNGAEALDYVRQRYQFADGDFTRERHQQEFLKALLNKAVSTGTVTNPARLNAFLDAITKTVTVDRDFNLVGTAFALRNLRSGDITFLTSPSAGTGWESGQSVVRADTATARSLYRAVGSDTVAQWLAGRAAGSGASATPTRS